MQIAVLVLDGVFDTGLSTVLDTLQTANELGGLVHKSPPRFQVQLLGLGEEARTQQGFGVSVTRAKAKAKADVVVVPALGVKTPPALCGALEQQQVRQASDLLGEWAGQGLLLTAACTGTFVLAEAGLLNGQRATTTWWLAPLFRERFPEVELDDSRMLVRSGSFITAGAALAHLDLALMLIRAVSPALATLVARYLVVEPHATQALFAIPDHLAHADPVVERFERWARLHLAERFSLDEAARATGTSQRTLARRLKQTLDKSPLGYVQELRVERAVHLLQTSDESLEDIAEHVGYEDGVSLANLLRRHTGRGVRELRSRPKLEPAPRLPRG